MSDEPRRSGRATKGQHKNAEASPVPAAPPKPPKTAKSKPSKKSQEPEPEDNGEEEEIRCICGNNNPKDKRAFIGCDDCTVWQHNVCMGITDDEDDVPDHYSCEKCGPEEHQETIQALAKGEKIWETRNKIYQNEKKMSKNRKGKTNAEPGWLKKDVPPPVEDETQEAPAEIQAIETRDTGTKRKREEVKVETSTEEAEVSKPTTRGTRQDKRRKSAAPEEPATVPEPPSAAPDPESALVSIDQLPVDRQKIAIALSKIITEVITEKADAGFRVPDAQTPKSLGDRNASLIEYELQMVHGGPANPPYMGQFRALNANLKKNKVLVERLLHGSLTPNELATMESKDMASEELQKERATMKEQLDRQAVAIQEEGPRYRRTHKGDELIEDENQHLTNNFSASSQPVRERVSVAEGEDDNAASPASPNVQTDSPTQTTTQPLNIDTSRPAPVSGRRQSSQNFDMNNIWAKTAGSPTSANGPRPLHMPPRRRSSVHAAAHEQDGGTKHDAEVDRMLEDDDEPYSPADTSGQDVIWRGKLVQSSDGVEAVVNARWVAGRDLTPTVAWRDLLPGHLTIDGRLQIQKAEEYLCSLQWSNSSDVSILALTPFNDAEVFDTVFQYFKTRERYAVVNKDKPAMVHNMYIIPVDAGAELPEHVKMLEHCTLKSPVEEKLLLASVVVARAPGTPPGSTTHDATQPNPLQSIPQATNGQHLPQHVRPGGPAGSPMTAQNAVFSPSNNGALGAGNYTAIPPNPYTPTPPPQAAAQFSGAPSHHNPLVAEVLGTLQFAPTAQQIISADPSIDREKLENLRRIMEEDPLTRTDINALAGKLMG